MATMIRATSVCRLRPGWRLQWEEAQQRHVLLYPEGMVQLNDTAGAILGELDGQRDVEAVIQRLEARYPQAPAGAIALDVQAFLVEASQQGWIQHD
ncbi:pyrroloquinoline quinone biosynthesis peptide chaperone PqqD [Halomonas mongoliensis]|jgi:pyrroloquinoline quinone biosynthesis protein D|uniref:PqqA binding protein n=1 Tax=Halomonas mongoliensis TaxID=321265 RepID=A0ABU1GJZ3_9GAMM|nr:pyrroloquinoline quinone biosynthesis peptide chaperone PqqD [Halomonas mongoliensis]MDR5892284.1 pyrroloquinoline quinone biosynthesis peptide chaperone PqqD [Halomonas mongoliensis]